MSETYSPGYAINSDASDEEPWIQADLDPAAQNKPSYGTGSDAGDDHGEDDSEDEIEVGGLAGTLETIKEGGSRSAPAGDRSRRGQVRPIIDGRGIGGKYRDPLSDSDDGEAETPIEPSRKRPRLEEPPVLSSNGSSKIPRSAAPHPVPQPLPIVMPARPPFPNPSQFSNGPPPEAFGLPPNAKPHHPMPGLIMSSYFGISPLDAVQRCVSDWLMKCAAGITNVEIEIKLGILIDKKSNRRISLPVLTDTVLAEGFEADFRSEMSLFQHYTMNQKLNAEVERCSGQVPHPHIAPHQYHKINYKHTFETDSIFLPYRGPGGGSGVKRRVTTLTKTGEFKEVVEKRRVANLNVHCPADEFDFRISINSEVPCPPECYPTAADRVEAVRHKDRVSYQHSFFQIDLTQVKQSMGEGKPTKVSHELEVEIANAAAFLEQAWFESQGRPNTWEAQLGCLLNTVRLLNRNAGPKVDPRKGPPQQG